MRDAVFCEGGFRKGECYCSETGGPDGLIKENLYYPRLSLQLSDDLYNGKGIMCRTERFKYIRRLYEKDELYDLEKDPKEVHNEIDNLDYQQTVLFMKEWLITHYQETCDVVPLKRDERMDQDMWRNMKH